MADEGTDGGGADRRTYERFDTELSVDWASEDHFLFSYITNISEMGIFIRTDEPAVVGTRLSLRFGLSDQDPLDLDGEVVWINPVRQGGDNLNPGMGVRFTSLSPEQRERVVTMVKTIAYLQDDEPES
ncbi:MAG: TIGR02266 family protein [Myxococcota bacterium]|nr:TIGR02266 family protein [Myxococcota bacterium]